MGLIYHISMTAIELRLKDMKLTRREKKEIERKIYSSDPAQNASARILLWGEDNRLLNIYTEKAVNSLGKRC